MSDAGEEDNLPSEAIDNLAELSVEEAITFLRDAGWWNLPSAMILAEAALGFAEVDQTAAGRLLAVAAQIGAEQGEPAALQGQIAFAEARRAVHSGELVGAEAALLRAQESWRAIDASVPFARTYLGLTQVLSMQGRYADADVAAQSAIDALMPLSENDPSTRMLLSRAYRNQANLYVYQEQHAAARDAFSQAVVEVERFRELLPPEDQGELEEELGHLALNLASAHTFLDAPDEAETLLLEAITRFDIAQDEVNRGRAQTNLGRLYLRLGEYATALSTFDLATRDLVGELPLSATLEPENEIAALRQADELLLEQAMAYLSLNLLPEAALALDRCERLFRSTGQPYELAQSRYVQGVLRLQQGALAESRVALDEAATLYGQLDNRFWHNRTQTARARLAQAEGDRLTAIALVDGLLSSTEMTTPTGAVAWDLLGLVDVWLLRLQLWLEEGNGDEAEGAAQAVEALLGSDTLGQSSGQPQGESTLPHLALRLLHGRGRIAIAGGDNALARRHFSEAVELLDRQRSSLPLEEIRTAYLDDKMAIYSDLVLSLLAAPSPNDDEVAAAFAVIERARSRALLERLLASVETVHEGESAEASAQRAALRRQLHWLYNQLLGEGGNRRVDGNLGREVIQHEAAIQQLEWRSAPLLAQAEPVNLDQLQAILATDQQALVFYFAGNEIMAFVVGQHDARVVRHLTTVNAVVQAQAELRFQLGRAEMGSEYVARHQARFLRGVQAALGQLYNLLIAPIMDQLVADRLLIIPYGALHLVPFHALWDGNGYWLERVELTFVPSASVAVHKQRDGAQAHCTEKALTSFAGFAPYDARIPQAQAEIDAASNYFEVAERFHHESASITNLRHAATSADVLHLATHGLFRPDNSFFSAIKLADGWLDVREIYRLPLSARLVVLSACESGVGEVRAGDEVVGLARGFLAAGAQHIVATLWNVHDSSAAVLMDAFYHLLPGDLFPTAIPTRSKNLRPAAALRAAQIIALRTGEHPYYWAPFFAIG